MISSVSHRVSKESVISAIKTYCGHSNVLICTYFLCYVHENKLGNECFSVQTGNSHLAKRCSCGTTKHIMRCMFKHMHHTQVESGMSGTPDISHNFMNWSRLNPLVSMSATISSVGQYCGSIVPFSTCS